MGKLGCSFVIATALCYASADVSAMYGKMSGCMSYDVAKTPSAGAEANKKAAEAEALAIKVCALNKASFNNLPTGMTPEEFIYELLNWPSDQGDAKIPEDLMSSVLAIDALNSSTKRECFNELVDKLVAGRRLISKAQLIDHRTTEAAVSDALDKFVKLDKDATDLLGTLKNDVETAGHNDITKIAARIDAIMTQLQQLYERSGVDFDGILKKKREGAKQVYNDPANKVIVATKESIASKREALNALVAAMKSLAEQLQIPSRQQKSVDVQTDLVSPVHIDHADSSAQTDLTRNVQSQDTMDALRAENKQKARLIVNLQNEMRRVQDEKDRSIAYLTEYLNESTKCAIKLDLVPKVYYKYIEFRDRIIDLLTRAQTGNDYRLVDKVCSVGLCENLQYAQWEYTLAGIASNWVRTYGDISKGDFRKASQDVSRCIGLLKKIGVSLKEAEMRDAVNEIRDIILKVFRLLPIDRLGVKNRVLVGRSIGKALETVIDFCKYVECRDITIELPDDSQYEICIGNGIGKGKFDDVTRDIVPEDKTLSVGDIFKDVKDIKEETYLKSK
ncbi:hypothetical protein FACS1894122_07200 [Alphaproteobacteria bacterium]|nr:hypothetical protein FACS1894122_07200 [Alphaproteobacteria bacterium]